MTIDDHKAPFRIAIVGAGYMAGEHARAFASIPGVSIVGIAGRDPGRARGLADLYAVPSFQSVQALYEATRADAVVVAVNELSVREVCLDVFRYSWKVLVEKPAGLDLKDAGTIVDASRKAGRDVYVAFNRRCYSSTRQALHMLEEGTGPRLISVLDQQDLASVRDSGQPQPVIENYMFANSIHLIDYLSLFGRGTVTEVRNLEPWRPQAPGFVVASVHFDSGDVGIYQAVWNGPGPWSVTVTNEAVRAELRPLEKFSFQRRGERRLTEVAADAIDNEFKPGLHLQAREFVKALRGDMPDLATIDDSFRSMQLCAKIYGFDGA